MNVTVETALEPGEADYKAIFDPLVAFNRQAQPGPPRLPFALLLRSTETGEVVGGLWALTYFGWTVVDLLFVPEALRGQGLGSRLLSEAEQIARARGCRGLWLITYGFQAPGFYRKQGYVECGRIDDMPPGSSRITLKKEFLA